MTKNLDSLFSKFYSITQKTLSRFLYTQVAFLLALYFASCVPVVAQTYTINYNDSSNWMCHPVLKTTDVARQHDLNIFIINKDNLPVDTIKPQQNPDTTVDIFYIYPTIDMKHELGNTEMDSINRAVAEFVYREQVGIYAQFGRVFVPYYRQAKIGVFVAPTPVDSLKFNQATYLEKAYYDVESAFDNYLRYYNKGRKIILMGHSQGSDHMRFLLHNRFDNNPNLQSQLVVAISGGEPNYAAKDSLTGGTLEHIETLNPNSPKSGCMISWRTWRAWTTGAALDSVSFFYNHYFVDKGLLYQTYDISKHQESNYDFGYSTRKTVTRYISLSPDSSQYWGFDDMFSAKDSTEPSKPDCTYLMIDTLLVPNDLRNIPNPLTPADALFPLFPSIPIPAYSYFTQTPAPNNNYHCWDMQFVQGDLLLLLPKLIELTKPLGVPEEYHPENNILIYPNPATDIVHLSNLSSKIKIIRLYNIQGKLIQEFFTNDFSVSNLTAGVYFIRIQTDNSAFNSKLVKQ